MSNVTSEGNVLAYVEKDAKAPRVDRLRQRSGQREAAFRGRRAGVSADTSWRAHARSARCAIRRRVEPGTARRRALACGLGLRADRQCTIKVAFDHREFEDYDSNIQPRIPRAFRLRWMEAAESSTQSALYTPTARVEFEVTEATVSSVISFGLRLNNARTQEVTLQTTGKDTQVTDVTGVAVRGWKQENGVLSVTLEHDGSTKDITVSLRRSITSAAEAGELPLLALNPPLHAVATLNLAADLDFLDLVGAKQTQQDTFEFQLGVDQPKLVLRTSKQRLESDVDVVARIDKDSVQIERKIMLRSDRPVSEIKLTLPAGEEFNAILSKPVGSDQQVSMANAAAMPNPAQQERLITPNIVSQPVFSQSAVTPNSGTAVTAGSQFRLTWRRVGQTIAILPAQPLSPTNALEFSITSRLKLTKAWKGPRTPESVTIEHLQIPEAVKVAGYTALDFDDSWRVALKEAKGLEDRDARLTPVKGRMAWFGLREHSLTFEVERAEAVFSTEVTAYALPRARTIEIEGQFALDISGAPLRSFQVKLPVENAKLLRVTSPLVGEQQLDEATGVWTFTLRQESKGQQNVRWRMSLPATSSEATPEDADKSVRVPITATLPRLELPQSRRFAGTWVIEANTDTQLSTKMQNMQPLDVLRVPVVAGYQPRHRITSAFTFGAGENALTITAQRHAHSELAALVVNRMSLISVLGTDGHSLHEATLDLGHSGEQFVSLHLPKDAELLSTSSGGQAVKPVRSVEDAIAIPLPAGSANAPHTEVRVQFRQNGAPWNRSGTQNLEPVRIVGNVPVLSTDWAVHAPAAFGYAKVDTTLEQEGDREIEPLRNPVSVLWEAIQPRYAYAKRTPQPVSGMANREIARRYARVEDGRAAMDRGDKLFTEGDYEGALGSYRAAVDALPNAPEIKEWLDLAQLKQADCSVVVARERAKAGKHDDARQLLNQALQLVPGHKAATTFMQQVNDSNRWPQTETVNAMAQVQKGLLLANSSVELGDYDAAISQYQDVLRVDPYNGAARRGMESVERRRQEYFKSAYDHQRAKMLAQVDESWEDKTPVQGSAVAFDYGIGRSPGAYLTEKMNKIILPKVELRGATIEQAIDYLRVKMREADTSGDASKGFSILLRTGNAPSNASISLDLKDVPMSEALRYVTELAQMKYKVEAHAVLVTPLSENASEMQTRTYRVPPDFLTAGGDDFGAAAAPADPFAAGGDTPKRGTGLVARKTAKQILESQGITFPEGASASFNPATGQIVVRNTQPNLDLAEAMVSTIGKSRTDDSRLSYDSIDEMRFKSGLIPLDVVLPETGRLLRFHGAQPPEALALHYTSWSQQMVRAVLAMALGLALFWRYGRKRPWFLTLLVVVLAAWGAPLLFDGTWLALANAVAFGWLCAGALWLLGWLFSFIRPHRQQFYISSRRAAA
jgi:tetratricopeptide (TPR) repeat protein